MKIFARGGSGLADLVSGILSILLGSLTMRLSFGFQVKASDRVGGGIDAALYPRLISTAVIILGLVLLIQGVQARLAAPTNRGAVSADKSLLVLLALYTTLVIFTLVLNSIGYVIASLVLIAVVMVLLGERRALVIAVVSVAVTTGIFIAFRHGFNIVLPEGLLAGI